MDKRNICHRGKKKSTKKTKKYATVDYHQSHFYNLREGRKIPFDSSGKAVVVLSPVYKITFFGQDEPPKKIIRLKLSFARKRKASPDVAGQGWLLRHGSTKPKRSSAKFLVERAIEAIINCFFIIFDN